MPLLDVSDAFDVDNTDVFQVIRRPETVNDSGESETTDASPVDAQGVICAASPEDLERLDDNDRMQRTISIVTQYRLRGTSRSGAQDWKPDIIVWPKASGEKYEVKLVEPYTRYGAGFVQALAGSIMAVDAPPT